MAKSSKGNSSEPSHAHLSVSREEAEQRLEKQLIRGKSLIDRIVSVRDGSGLKSLEEEYYSWSDYNSEVLRRIFTNEQYVYEYNSSYALMIGRESFIDRLNGLKDDIESACGRIDSIKNRLELIPVAIFEEKTQEKSIDDVKSSRKIFIVHGHNQEAKIDLARTLEKVGLEPIILHEQINSGSTTVIDKFERNSNVKAAIILLTADDEGKSLSATTLSKRARQNVVFEMGYFMGKLSMRRVVVLYKGGPELPSDIAGIVYIEMDVAGAWKYTMSKELKEMGLDIDMNRI